jgi:two-component system cell cycle sensor histidine kinase/response regulator CckA
MNRDAVTFLVADVSLPDGNGCALASALRNQKADLRVLFVSGNVGAEVCKYYGLKTGALHFLRKPFVVQKLVDRVRKILKSRQGFPRLFLPKALTSSGKHG